MVEDTALIEAFRAGDRNAGAKLFDRYYASVARFFRNKVGPQEANDLIQNTFLACFEGLDRMRTTNFRSYVFAVGCNLLRKHFRTKRRHPVDFGTVSVFDIDPSPSSVMAESERQQHLLEALRRIPIDHQVVLELFYWESMTAAEISEVIEVPVGTVKTRIRRARQLLQEKMVVVANDGPAAQCSVEDLDDWAGALRQQMEST
ncbi:MAG: sigma-70 family RNA polymerase sigma factor [Myxococcota bacterium]